MLSGTKKDNQFWKQRVFEVCIELSEYKEQPFYAPITHIKFFWKCKGDFGKYICISFSLTMLILFVCCVCCPIRASLRNSNIRINTEELLEIYQKKKKIRLSRNRQWISEIRYFSFFLFSVVFGCPVCYFSFTVHVSRYRCCSVIVARLLLADRNNVVFTS